MGLGKESIEERVSRIELDIDHMNRMIDENLKLNEAGSRLDQDDKIDQVKDKRDSAQESVTSTYSEEKQEKGDNNSPVREENRLEKWSEDQKQDGLEETQHAPGNNGMELRKPENSGKHESNDEWEDEIEETDQANKSQPIQDTTQEAAPQVARGGSILGASTQSQNQSAIRSKEQETAMNDSLEYSYESTQKRTIGTKATASEDDGGLPDTKQNGSSRSTLEEQFHDSLYDTYDAQPEFPSRQNSESVPPHTASTSQELSIDADGKLQERSPSPPLDSSDSIHIPKNNQTQKSAAAATAGNTPVSSRRPTNPFRVVSVGVVGPDGRTSRRTSAGTFSTYKDSQTDGPAILQKKLDQSIKKCSKLQREIDYLNKISASSSLPIDDSRKLSRAIDKLQEHLDKKNKEKYDTGVLLSRQLRREIDRGENGQFWVGTK